MDGRPLRFGVLLALALLSFAPGRAPGQDAVKPQSGSTPPTPSGEPVPADPALEAAAVPTTPPNPYAGDLRTRLRATGDWGGTRSALAERGLTFDLFATQFYQGVAAGGQQRAFEFGGKLDYLFNVDGGKLGLWDGVFLNLHAETRYGASVNTTDGLLTPSNLPLSFPEPEGSISSVTGLKLTQALSENAVVFLGKINTLDEYGFRYAPGLGTNRPGLEGFMNTSLVFNPIVGRTVPYSAAGVGFAVLKEGEPLFAVTVFDPEERATKGLEDLFTRGAVVVTDLTLDVKPFGRPGRYNFGGTYSNAQYRSFDPAAYLGVLRELVRDEAASPKETGSWSVYANFYQSLWVDAAEEKRNWGLFGQFGVSDGNPNPVRFVANGGLAGRSMISGRQYDTFGVGYFYVGLSDNFQALARPILPQRDEYGVELFYNLAVTPWARLTADLQVARPSTAAFDTAVIPGIRFQLLF